MTLTSKIAVRDPVNPESLHAFATALLNPDRRPVRLTNERKRAYRTIANEPGQGLAARLFTHYGEDGPLPPRDDPGHWAWPAEPACVLLSFDTPYSYRENGATCNDLHAWIISEVGAYLDELGARNWTWLHEYDGDWYPGHTIMPSGEDSAQLYVLGDVAKGDPRLRCAR